MNQPDGIAAFAFAEGMPRDAHGPVFAEPWQAQAFALAVRSTEAGFFTWREWADELAAVLGEAAARVSEKCYARTTRLSMIRIAARSIIVSDV